MATPATSCPALASWPHTTHPLPDLPGLPISGNWEFVSQHRVRCRIIPLADGTFGSEWGIGESGAAPVVMGTTSESGYPSWELAWAVCQIDWSDEAISDQFSHDYPELAGVELSATPATISHPTEPTP